MTQTTKTCSSGGGPYTFSASTDPNFAFLVGSSVAIIAVGGAGGKGNGGGVVYGSIPMLTSDSLSITVGNPGAGVFGGAGYHHGGNGGNGGASWAFGYGGGGSTAILKGGTVYIEAAGAGGDGGGGAFGGTGVTAGGAGGTGDLPATDGAPGPSMGYFLGGGGGHGATATAEGASGTSVNSNYGNPGLAGVGGAGGAYGGGAYNNGGGGGGGGGHHGGGGGGAGMTGPSNSGAPGAGGGGGCSYADPAVSSPTFSHGSATPVAWITYTYVDPFAATTLVAPANNAYVDAATVGVTFKFTPHPGTDSGPLNAYCLRVKNATSGSYLYWNGTSLQTTQIWMTIASTVTSVTIPAGIFANNNSFNWAISLREGTYNRLGAWPTADNTFHAVPIPTPTITSPSGTITAPTGTVTWAVTLTGGYTQQSYRVLVYTLAQATALGFSPGQGVPLFDSGVVASSSLSASITATLNNATSYRAYVQIVEVNGGATATSQWASSNFTLQYDGPAIPTLALTTGTDVFTGCPIVNLVLNENENMLPLDDSTLEVSIGTWAAAALCTATRTGAAGEDGTYSLSMIASGSGNMAARTATGTGGVHVAGGIQYTAIASFKSAGTVDPVQVSIEWYDASGTIISTSNGTAVNDTVGGWTKVSCTATSPSGGTPAAYATVRVTVQTVVVSELHYVDEVGLFQSAIVPAWSAGGYFGATTGEIQYSDDQTNWFDVRNGASIAMASQAASLVDAESPFNTPRYYRARMNGTVTSQPVSGQWTAVANATLTSKRWWLLDPVTQSEDALNFPWAMPLYRVASGTGGGAGLASSITIDQQEQQGVTRPLGRPIPVLVRGDMYAEEFDIGFMFNVDSDRQAFNALRLRRVTLCLRSDMGTVYYVALGPARPVGYLSMTERVMNPASQVIVHCIPQDIP